MTHTPRPRVDWVGEPQRFYGITPYPTATCRDCQEPLVLVRSGRLSLPGERHWRHRPQRRGTVLSEPVFDILEGKR